MKSALIEIVVTFLAAVVLVAATLALLPGEGSWLARTGAVLQPALSGFDYSTVARDDVLPATLRAAGLSVLVIAGTTLLLLLVGVPLGILSALRSRDRYVQAGRRFAVSLSSLPVIVWCTLLFVVVARAGGGILRGDSQPVAAVLAAVVSLLLGDRILSDLVQRVALRTREVLAEPYMRTVRASGFGVVRHLVQSLIPAVGEAVAARAVFLVSGAIVAERIFEIHGLGYLVISALVTPEQEMQLILACAMALVAIGLALRLASRAAALAADPRRRA